MGKKICHLTTVHPAFDIRIFHKECKSLLQAGYDVTLIAQHGKDEIVDGIKIRALPTTRKRVKRMLKLPWIALRKALEENADLYHFHDPELIPIGLILKVKGKKVIYDIHEDVPRQILSKPYLRKVNARIISCAFERFENFAGKRFDFLVTVAPNVRDRFLRVNRKVIDIQNYPLLYEMYSPLSWEARENAIAYTGGIARIRGIIELVSAMEHVNATLHLAGTFEDSKLEQTVRQLPGWAKVNYHGYVDRAQVKAILGSVKVGVITILPAPNHLYAVPNKLFEYMSASIPVVASNFPWWSKIIEGNRCGICVDPFSPADIADAINYLLEHPKEAEEMGKNGRRAVEEKYNWETESKKLLQVYRELLQEDRSKD